MATHVQASTGIVETFLLDECKRVQAVQLELDSGRRHTPLADPVSKPGLY